jgi:glycogen(starch) synthase
MKNRILHFVATMAPPTCGYAIRTANILRRQRQAGYELMPLALWDLPEGAARNPRAHLAEWTDAFGTTYFGPLANEASAMCRLLRIVPRLGRALAARKELAPFMKKAEEFRPDIVHAHSPFYCGVSAKKLADRLKVPFVYEVRGLWEESAVAEGEMSRESKEYAERRRMEIELASSADAVVAISEGLRAHFEKSGVAPQKIFVVPNGVDADSFNDDRLKPVAGGLSGLRGKFVFAYSGNVRRLEGLELVLESLPEILRGRPEAHFAVIGDGKDLGALRQIVKDRQLDNSVTFTGSVPHEDVASLYASVDLFVLPRIRATVNELVTPLKPLEFMAAGRPVLASDVGGLKELITDGRTGMLFKAGDASDFAGKVVMLAGDDRRRKELADSGREWVKRERTWERVCTKYADLYSFVQG